MKSAKYIFAIHLFMILSLGSCRSQQATPTTLPTVSYFFTATPRPTQSSLNTSEPIPNKFSLRKDGKIEFDNWKVSFLLPDGWDKNKYFLGFQASPYTELYFFYGPGKDEAELSFDFRHLPENVNKIEYLNTLKNWSDDPNFKIARIYSPKELGINWNSAIGYKCQFRYGAKLSCFDVRVIYENNILEIKLITEPSTFQQIEPQFFEIIKSLSIDE